MDTPAAKVRDMINWYFVSRAIFVAAQHDIASRLSGGAKTAQALADELSLHGLTLHRMLRALASRGIFREDEKGRFANTELSECLREDVPNSLRGLALLFGDDTSWKCWEELPYCIQTGKPSFEKIYGEEFWDYLSHHPEKAAMFDRAMASSSGLINDAVASAYDFSAAESIVDVAGGIGSTLCAILGASPRLKGVLFDLPHLQQRAEQYIAGQGLSGRCKFRPGSFFDAVPRGAGLYFMKHIVHDWDDANCIKFLRNARAAMSAGSKLLVCERIVPPGNEPFSAKWSDLHMLVHTHGGRERTEAEFRDLYERSGFRLSRAIPTKSDWSLIEGVPV
ncbi:MAG: methyltransferase [Burkholderiales bacterium]